MILVDFRGGEPFAAHLIVEAIAPSGVASGEAICGACGDYGDRTKRDKPEFHDVDPDSRSLCASAACKNNSDDCAVIHGLSPFPTLAVRLILLR